MRITTLTVLIQTSGTTSEILQVGLKMLLCTAASAALAVFCGFLSAKTASGFSFTIREQVFHHVMSIGQEEMSDFSVPSLITRTTNDITQIQMIVAMGLQMMIKAPIMAVWGVIKILGKSWELSAVTAVFVAVICVTIFMVMATCIPRFRIVQKLTDSINRVARENLTGINVVHAFNAEPYQNEKFDRPSKDMIFDFLESEEMPNESSKQSALPAVRGQVIFDHVRFSYPDAPGKIIIRDFSAQVQPGQKVAIVGPTGAGQTTMVNLLMRFFEINSGSISIDGVNISDLRRETLHSLFGMVLQDTWLFEGTVRENLVYNMQNITDEQLETVCRACGLDKFVHALPEGFDTVLSDSTSISAGQKQLLTIARAMLQNAPMLILDEATSSVDTRTELLIQRAMDDLTKGRTSFVIAHRLSTIRNADLILVMKDGDVIESGTHDALIAQNGFYAELYNSQFEQTA